MSAGVVIRDASNVSKIIISSNLPSTLIQWDQISQDLTTLLESKNDLSMFKNALQYHGLSQYLTGGYTVIAPTNEVFEQVAKNSMIENPHEVISHEDMKYLLMSHIICGIMPNTCFSDFPKLAIDGSLWKQENLTALQSTESSALKIAASFLERTVT